MLTYPASQPIPQSSDVDDVEVIDNVEVVELAEAIEETRSSETSLHWSMLLAAAAVMVLAAILQVRGPETVVIPLVDMPLPGTCTYKKFVGMECPGCGLTRCFISLAHGRPIAAWYFNPAGILFFALVAGQIPFRGLQIWRIRRGLAEIRVGRMAHFLMGFLIVTLLTQWLIRSYFA